MLLRKKLFYKTLLYAYKKNETFNFSSCLYEQVDVEFKFYEV